MAVNGRAKGSRFERALAKQFEVWWGTKVSRTPLSGGWGSSGVFETSGDLVCAGGWPFVVEAKNHEGWHLEQLLANEKCPINSWWKQAVDAAILQRKPKKEAKIPMLVFTRNLQREYLMLPTWAMRQLSPLWTPLGSVFEAYMDNTAHAVYVMLLDDFFRVVMPPKPSPNWNRKPKQKTTAFVGLKKRAHV